MSLRSGIDLLQSEIQSEGLSPENGLGTDLFNYVSTLTPIVNVDLFVVNSSHQILLSWRDDPNSGTGWYVPGGCIRYREPIEERIHKTAKSELGQDVIVDSDMIGVYEIIRCKYAVRGHFISLAYRCKFVSEFDTNKQKKAINEPGYLKWFNELPDNFLQAQACYKKDWINIKSKLWRKFYGTLEK